MAIINTNIMTVAGTHGVATVDKTKVVARMGGFEFPEPYKMKLKCYIHFFVTNGADVMAPGIVDADIDIDENDQVWICDEVHNKPLAIGIANMTGEQMIAEKKGKAITTVHYVGDYLWKAFASML